MDLLHARTALCTQMLARARQQRGWRPNTRVFVPSWSTLLCIPCTTIDVILLTYSSREWSPGDILVDTIRGAANDNTALVARLKPIITNKRTSEHYHSVLNLMLIT
ncbi:hypothetical protein JVU11DRAFT_10859 [Chiua virens]|nr:hypothetical protein JVU11DRAFT_10859 [Chiua virens]